MFKRNDSIIFAIELIIDKQIRYNDPPETAHTYRRLISSSFSDSEARRLIYMALQVELIQLMRYGEAFNNTRFVNNLGSLPDLPEAELN
ncbi:MAG: hypothetical protein RBR28_05155 [Lentimicrobium sp.]|jgi:hypothetical protein|nr:hypothetical protein [Lentimicrobium sp.]